MISHTKKHFLTGFTKIYQVKNAGGAYFRPEEHTYNTTSGKCFQGSDARFLHFVLPKNVQYSKNVLFCRRNCGFKLQLKNESKFAKKAVGSVRRFIKHEARCRGPKKL